MKPAEAYKKFSDLYNDWWAGHGQSWSFNSFILEHKKEVEELKKIIIQDANLAIDFSTLSGRRWREAEPNILTNPKAASKYFYIHIRYFPNPVEFQGVLYFAESDDDHFYKRWLEAEAIILKGTPNSIFDYYYKVIDHGRKTAAEHFPDKVWKEAEAVFTKKMSIFHQYVLITEKNNETYEQKILEEPDNKYNAKYIYEYCCKILKERWIEAEPILLKNPDYAAKYCTKFDLPVPEETHNQMLAEVAFNTKTASYKKKYLEKDAKKKKIIKQYLKELINNKTITKDMTVEELIK